MSAPPSRRFGGSHGEDAAAESGGGREDPAAAFQLFSASAHPRRGHPQGLAAGVLAKLWMRVSKP